jgi:nucleotide-binding universal stress UspA family protein
MTLTRRDVRWATPAVHGLDLSFRQNGRTDDLVDRLRAIADEVDASVLAIGLRHRTAVGKLLMGSNVQRILLHSVRPVLAVKA